MDTALTTLSESDWSSSTSTGSPLSFRTVARMYVDHWPGYTRGKKQHKYCEFIYLLFPCPRHFFQCWNPFFFLCKDQLGCGCWFIPSFKFTKHQGRKGVWVHPTAKPGSAERAGAEGRSIICQHLFCTHPGVKTHLSGFGKRGHLEETVKHLKRLLSSSSSNFMLLFCFMIVFKACLYYLK